MKFYMTDPQLFKSNQYSQALKVEIFKIEEVSKVTEFKELLNKYDFSSDPIIAFDNKKLIKWLCKLPKLGFHGGEAFEPREELTAIFHPQARIMYLPSGLNAWTEPEAYMDSWRFAYTSLDKQTEKNHIWRDFEDCKHEIRSADVLAIDIETTGLNYSTDKIRSIGFCFKTDTYFRTAVMWEDINKDWLARILTNLTIKVFHNGSFDLTFLCRELSLHPLEVRNVDDTKLIAYCNNNSARSGDYSLGYLARSFISSWKLDSLKAEGQTLLEYNSLDCAATLWLYNNNPQTPFYHRLKGMIPRIVGMQLTGWPLNRVVTQNTNTRLLSKKVKLLLEITKAVPGLNPNSPKQLAQLFIKDWKLDSYDKTSSGGHATGSKALEYFMTQLEGSPEKYAIVKMIFDFKEIDMIAKTFLPPMMRAIEDDCFMRGSYNIGGTKSGRLSSSDPNLQNVPSHSTFAKDIKHCFSPPKGWVIIGADYKALEDRVSALTTRDPEKLKVYTDGFDGHCLRANAYFKLGIDPSQVDAINAIAELYPELRQKSKGPTFALTYQGTIITLIKNCGFDYTTAEQIYNQFHTLYAASDKWVDAQLEKGKTDGYIRLAYGHILKTPLLKNSIQGKCAPYLATKERRTAANALGQSYCMVTGFAGAAMYREIYDRELWWDIKPIGEIHDATYWLVKDDPKIIDATLEMLHKHMPNHKLAELDHPTIKLDIDAFIIREDWAHPKGVKYVPRT